jgi:hypothetical protein
MTRGPAGSNRRGCQSVVASGVKRLLVSLGAMPLGYALGPVLARESGYAWPLTAAAVLVLLALSIPVSLPAVRDLRLRGAAANGRQVDLPLVTVASEEYDSLE